MLFNNIWLLGGRGHVSLMVTVIVALAMISLASHMFQWMMVYSMGGVK